MVFLLGIGAWALCALICACFCALICRGGQQEDRLLAQHAESVRQEAEMAHPALPTGAAGGLGPRTALDDVLRTAQQSLL